MRPNFRFYDFAPTAFTTDGVVALKLPDAIQLMPVQMIAAASYTV
jgi:hypothetical protein